MAAFRTSYVHNSAFTEMSMQLLQQFKQVSVHQYRWHANIYQCSLEMLMKALGDWSEIYGTVCRKFLQDRGLIPRVFQELFAQIKEKKIQQVSTYILLPQIAAYLYNFALK